MKFAIFKCRENDRKVKYCINIDKIIHLAESKSYSDVKTGIFLQSRPAPIVLPGYEIDQVLKEIQRVEALNETEPEKS